MDSASYPNSLRDAREIAHLTQEQLAERIGVTRAAVSQWEVGATVPSGPARRQLAQSLVVPIEVVDEWFERRVAA